MFMCFISKCTREAGARSVKRIYWNQQTDEPTITYKCREASQRYIKT